MAIDAHPIAGVFVPRPAGWCERPKLKRKDGQEE